MRDTGWPGVTTGMLGRAGVIDDPGCLVGGTGTGGVGTGFIGGIGRGLSTAPPSGFLSDDGFGGIGMGCGCGTGAAAGAAGVTSAARAAVVVPRTAVRANAHRRRRMGSVITRTPSVDWFRRP